MALINCPSCNKKVSDKAESCPKCGHPLKENNKEVINNTLDKLKGKWDYKYLLIIIAVVAGVYFIFFNKPKENINSNPNTELKPNANGNYEFNQNGKYFEFPSNYKAYVSKDGTIYVGQHIDNDGALIPYIMIEKYKGYKSPEVLLNELTTAIGKEYTDAVITISMLSAYIGDKYVYGMQFAYTSSNHLVIDNRYAFLVNDSMYLVTTKEENVNTDEINNVARLIMETLKEVK